MAQKKSNLKQSESSNGKKQEQSQNSYFLSLELENVRCFGERQIIYFSDYDDNPKQWTIILGDNGTGKTTLLQSIIAMIPTPIHSDWENAPAKRAIIANFLEFELTNEGILRRNPVNYSRAEKGKISFYKKKQIKEFSIESVTSVQESLKITKEAKVLQLKISGEGYTSGLVDKDFFEIRQNCFSYGANRKASEVSLSEAIESTHETLFNENALLVNPEEWLLQADYYVSRSSAKKSKNNFRRVKNLLISVLPDVDNIKISESKEREKSFPIPIVEFHTPYGWVESKDLSLGYRTSMAWMVDFASRMFDLYPESENPLAEPAVVLIDEIDLHLHPKWQRELLDYLSNLFPNTQFIVTTHSPLIVQSAVARDANIVVCRREGDHVVIDQITDALKNMRVDQILTAEYFNLPTARPMEIEPLLEEREKILSKAKLTKKDEKRLTELENEIGVMPVSENPEDDKAMDIIRRAAERLESQK